jgi:thiamine pyrophosphate-dependent acetolactate synthase large subunit-like protein
MKASDLFVKCLEAEGVEYIFGLPGEETNDLMMSLLDSKKITFILVRHEQAAAFMADVYGRITQKVDFSSFLLHVYFITLSQIRKCYPVLVNIL